MKTTRSYLDSAYWELPLFTLLYHTQTNLQTKTVAQLRDFVGKLGGLQTEHQSLRLRKHLKSDHKLADASCILADTGLSELLVPLTRTEHFNKSLEIQQSRFLLIPFKIPF